MYRRYYSYNDMPRLVNKCEQKDDKEHKKEEKPKECTKKCEETKKCESGKLFGRFELDDIILGVIIVAILLDDGDDSPLLLALALIFFAGMS